MKKLLIALMIVGITGCASGPKTYDWISFKYPPNGFVLIHNSKTGQHYLEELPYPGEWKQTHTDKTTKWTIEFYEPIILSGVTVPEYWKIKITEEATQ